MRVLRLDLEGFGPFRDRQVIDVTAAAEQGILLITGPTGAGKSSLFDAISFALYGAVPRYDGQVGRIRSDHLPPHRGTRVTLDVEIGAERFRVERTPEWQRPKKRGVGTTIEKATARLWRWQSASSSWEGIAARPVDVAAELSPVLGLSHEQFLQVVLLAQGGFQRFLAAHDDDRQATLRTLFRTQRFHDIERELGERRQQTAQALTRRSDRVRGALEQLERALIPDEDAAAQAPLAERIARVQAALADEAVRTDEMVRAAQAAELARATLEQRVQHVRAAAEARNKREQVTRELENLAEQAPERQTDREHLALAERAERIREPRAAAQRAEEAEAVAHQRWLHIARRLADEGSLVSQALHSAVTAVGSGVETSGGGSTGATPETGVIRTCEAELQRLDENSALLEAPEHEESQRELLERAHEDLVRVCDEHAQRQADLLEREEALPALVADAVEERDAARGHQADLGEAEQALSRARRREEAAQRLHKLHPQVAAAEVASARLAAELADAGTSLRDLHRDRISGMSGELAQQLIPGEPCAVCGSRAHPDPATQSAHVTASQVQAAEAALARVQQDYDAARQAETDLAHRLAAERAIAEPPAELPAKKRKAGDSAAGLSPQFLKSCAAAVVAAADRLAVAQAAAERLPTLTARTEALAAEAHALRSQYLEAVAAHTRAQSAVDASAAQLTASAERLRSAQGAYSSVRAHRVACRSQRDLVALVRDAARTLSETRHGVREYEDVVSAALASAGFADLDEVDAAMLSAAERRVIAERVEAHDSTIAKLRGILEDPAIANAPEAPVDVASIEAEWDVATNAAAASARAAGAAEGRTSEWQSHLDQVIAEAEGASAEEERLLRLREFTDAVQGKEPNSRRMRLEVFVLAAQLEAIVVAANSRLSRMVGGRYRLQHDDGLRSRGRQSGLGIAVIDDYTGRVRSTDSLSGGETFLVALSLALGLADVVTAHSGGIRVDTLFIDEGFGTLDPDALEQALAILDGLREGGRTVALISHVTEMKERLPAQLNVCVTPEGHSTVRGVGVIPDDQHSDLEDA